MLTQPPSLIVQAKTTGPEARLLTVVAASVGLAMVPDPDTTDQSPVPVLGVFAARVVDGTDAQTVWFAPATDGTATLPTVTLIVDVLGAHTPLDIAH